MTAAAMMTSNQKEESGRVEVLDSTAGATTGVAFIGSAGCVTFMEAAAGFVNSSLNHYVLLPVLGKEIEVVSTIDLPKLSIAP